MTADFVDNLMKLLSAQGGRGLRLESGHPAQMLDASGSTRNVSTRTLTRQEILGAIAPIVPEHAKRDLPEAPSVEFEYTVPAVGEFKVRIVRDGEQLAVSIVRNGASSTPPSQAAPTPAPAARGSSPRRFPSRRRQHHRLRPPVRLHPSRSATTAGARAGPTRGGDGRNRNAGDRSAVPRDVCDEIVGSPPLGRHAAARPQGRRAFSRSRTAPRRSSPNDGRRPARADHAGEEPRRVRAPARHRLRVRDRRARALPRQRLHGSQGAGRGLPRHPEQDPHRRGARPVAHHPAAVPAEQRAWCSSPARPAPASRRRSAR